jgi:hypothetical protein
MFVGLVVRLAPGTMIREMLVSEFFGRDSHFEVDGGWVFAELLLRLSAT